MKEVVKVAEDLRIVIGQLRRTLREQSTPESLTWSQVSVLGHLLRNGRSMTVTELAHAEGVKSQSMGAILTSLRALMFVDFAKDDGDGRKKRFFLTEKGVQLLKENRAQRDDWLVKVIQSSLSEEDRQILEVSILLLQRIALSSL